MRVSVIASLYQKKNYQEIISMVEKEQRKGNTNIDNKVLYYLVLSLINIGDTTAAIDLLDKIIPRVPRRSSFLYRCKLLKGYLLSNKGDYHNAQKELEQLIKDGYNTTTVYAALGHAVFKSNNKDLAITYLEKALELDPNNITALNSLSYIYAKFDVFMDKAITYIETVLRHDPRNPIYLDTYGYVLFRVGALKEAEKVLEQAYSMQSHAIIKQHLEAVRSVLASASVAQ